jgi:hypothetical protein
MGEPINDTAKRRPRAGESSTYTVKIRRWTGSGDMPYGIAWSTRRDFRLSSVLLSELLQTEGH